MKSIPTALRSAVAAETYLDRLLRLDSRERPGLTSHEFRRLFSSCPCGLVTTRKAFNRHICALATLVDLQTQEGAVVTGFTVDMPEATTYI